MKPPYQITPRILQLVTSISEQIGAVNASHLYKPPTELRKKNRIQTIQSSLEIEGNTLTTEQITALINNKRVLAPQKDITEVKNAIEVYDNIQQFDPHSVDSFLEAHGQLMHGLVENPGRFRTRSVGIVRGSEVTHVAPPGEMVPPLMNQLFNYLADTEEIPLIKSCVFHYEMEFIHPFVDGNGRMGRLWQTLLLQQTYPLFEYLPIEHLIKEQQQAYYQALSHSDNIGESTPFIEFMLQIIHEALHELLDTPVTPLNNIDRLELFKGIIAHQPFSRKEYMEHFKTISPATASRDLKYGVDHQILEKSGEKRNTTYRYK